MYVKGLDVSCLTEIENLGGTFSDKDYVSKDFFIIARNSGVNVIRLKLWVDPYDVDGNSYGGGGNDLSTTIKLAKRAQNTGLEIMLDIHYSDFWADPSHQIVPKEWASYDESELVDAVFKYTSRILCEFRKADIQLKYIQVGNEITNGFLWPIGHINNPASLFNILKSGIKAVRQFSRALIILHLDQGGNNELYRNWFDEATLYETDFDIIGLSYYPFWHGTLSELGNNMNDLANRYKKPMIVVETAMGFTLEDYSHNEDEHNAMIFNSNLEKVSGYPATEDGQARFISDLNNVIQKVPNNLGNGFIYWAPEWIPVEHSSWSHESGRLYLNDDAPGGNSWANLALFDYQGQPLRGLTQFGLL